MSLERSQVGALSPYKSLRWPLRRSHIADIRILGLPRREWLHHLPPDYLPRIAPRGQSNQLPACLHTAEQDRLPPPTLYTQLSGASFDSSTCARNRIRFSM